MARPMAPIVVRDVRKRFGDFSALDGVSFEVEEGSFFGCFGPNGAGKSTLLKIMTGQTKATSGEVGVLGMDPGATPLQVKSSIGIVPEVESPPSYLTAREFLQFAGSVRKVDDLEARVGSLHPYTVPEIVALPLVAGSAPYVEWVLGSVRG